MSRRLHWLPGLFAIARMDPGEPIPDWAFGGSFVSISRSKHELSVVTEQFAVPQDVKADRGWRAFMIAGPMELSTVGVLASITRPLADRGIPLFAISTYDTDYVLVRSTDAEAAEFALTNPRHAFIFE